MTTVSPLTIATWNVQRPSPRGSRGEPIREWLRRIDADVWVLTETHDDICPGPGYEGVVTQAADRRQSAGENWTTIWSRFPIRRLPETSDPARAVAAYVELPERRPLVVYGTVLPWSGSEWRGLPSRGGEAFRAALGVQRTDWLRLIEQFPDADLCVAGDLNQDLAGPHYYGSNGNRLALGDALAQCGLRCVTAEPDDPVRQVAPRHASIDHICLARHLCDSNSIALRVWPELPAPDRLLSDHFGVVATLTQ